MFHRKDAVYLAVAGLLVSSGLAKAADAPSTKLSLDPTVLTADDAAAPAPRAPLMDLLDKAGAAKPLDSIGLNIYGWIESGYTYNHRHHGSSGTSGSSSAIVPGPFNHEVGNHYMLDQVDLRFERDVDTSKFDVGGMVEVQYGTDAKLIHSSGLNFGGTDPSTDNNPPDAVNDKYQANYEFDLTQAFVDVNLPVGNGLTIRVGKFVTLLGYESIDPLLNPFYSHSYIFNALPFTQTGVLGMYKVNDQFSVKAGITRGWDQSLEDSGPAGGTCAIDGLGQFIWTPNKQLTAQLTWGVGPEDFGDTSHYRVVADPNITYQVTDAFSVGFEGLYIYDGGLNGNGGSVVPPTITHAYGDVWGGDLYLTYVVNKYFTLNSRFEKYHTSTDNDGAVSAPSGGSLSIYSITLGTTITPMPDNDWGKNVLIRPEIRYDFSDSSANPPFAVPGGNNQKDQLTFAADVIVKF